MGRGWGTLRAAGKCGDRLIRVRQTHTARGQLLEASWKRRAWKNKCVLAEGKGWAGQAEAGSGGGEEAGVRGGGEWGEAGWADRGGHSRWVEAEEGPCGDSRPSAGPRRARVGGVRVGWGNGWGVTPFPPARGTFLGLAGGRAMHTADPEGRRAQGCLCLP